MKVNISKNNTIELSVFGKIHPEVLLPNSSTRNLFYSSLYELFENDVHTFKYNITTYRYDRKEELSQISNLVEIYHNESDPFETKVDYEKFYNKINYNDNLEEFLLISPCFIKYISSNFVKKPSYGNAKIVELARCEENMSNVLDKLGYKEIRKILYGGELIKYGNDNILLSIFYINPNQQNNPNSRLKGVAELSAFCLDSDIENFSNKMKIIAQKLSRY